MVGFCLVGICWGTMITMIMMINLVMVIKLSFMDFNVINITHNDCTSDSVFAPKISTACEHGYIHNLHEVRLAAK